LYARLTLTHNELIVPLTIISFNINSLRARLHQLSAIIDRYSPDIILLQETKVQDHDFPLQEIHHLGYEAQFFGQKTHYGVATLYKTGLVSVQKGYPWDDEVAQKRFIHTIHTLSTGERLHVMNGYFPQGESRDHPTKFPYKTKFYADLMRYLSEIPNTELALIGGDFNISHTDADIGIGAINAKRWLATGKCSFLPEERVWFNQLMSWGWSDTFRTQHPADQDTPPLYSWFDYRSKGFEDQPKRGLRIDLLLASPALQTRLSQTGIDYDIRAMEKPSDHAPVWATFS
jgi:exodeoxyribonuclease-3